MKIAIVTICIGEFYQKLGAVTLPHIKKYAEKIGADFISISEPYLPIPHYAKFEIGKFYEL